MFFLSHTLDCIAKFSSNRVHVRRKRLLTPDKYEMIKTKHSKANKSTCIFDNMLVKLGQ